MAQDVDSVALANTAAGVVDHADIWTVIVVFILVAGVLIGVYIWKNAEAKNAAVCHPDGDCPGVKQVMRHLEAFAAQMKEDREEWRSLRLYFEGAIRGVHSRVDDLYQRR